MLVSLSGASEIKKMCVGHTVIQALCSVFCWQDHCFLCSLNSVKMLKRVHCADEIIKAWIDGSETKSLEFMLETYANSDTSPILLLLLCLLLMCKCFLNLVQSSQPQPSLPIACSIIRAVSEQLVFPANFDSLNHSKPPVETSLKKRIKVKYSPLCEKWQ